MYRPTNVSGVSRSMHLLFTTVTINATHAISYQTDGRTALEVASSAKDWNGIHTLLALKADMKTVFTGILIFTSVLDTG